MIIRLLRLMLAFPRSAWHYRLNKGRRVAIVTTALPLVLANYRRCAAEPPSTTGGSAISPLRWASDHRMTLLSIQALALRSHDPGLEGEHHRLEPIAQPELAEDPPTCSYGGFRDKEAISNFGVRQILRRARSEPQILDRSGLK